MTQGRFFVLSLFLCRLRVLYAVSFKQITDEHDDREEDQEADALLPAVARPDRVAEEQAAGNAQNGKHKALDRAKLLCLDHESDHHGDVHQIQTDDADLVRLPGEPLA